MSSTYTGNAGNITPANAVDIVEPSDGDAANAASVNGALSELADYTAFLKRAAYDGTYTVKQIAIDGVGNQATGPVNNALTVVNPTTNGLGISAQGNGTGAGVAGQGGATGRGVVGLGGSTSGAGGDFAAQAGNSDGVRGTASGTGAGVRAVTGSVVADAGNVVAGGTPVGNAGPGLAKAARFYATGTALVAGDFTLSAAWDTSTVTAVSGNDAAVDFTITAAGTPTADPVVVITFTDKTFTSAPVAMVALRDSNDATAIGKPVKFSTTATTLTIQLMHTPIAGKTYSFSAHVIGV